MSQDDVYAPDDTPFDDESIPYDPTEDDGGNESEPASRALAPVPTLAHPQFVQQRQAGFTSRQRELIKTTLAPGITDDQLELFALVAARTGLDPFQRQIYAVLRNSKERVNGQDNWVKKMTIQTGIDGFTAIAEGSEVFAGVDDIIFDTEDGDHPNRATATVWRWSNGQRVPFTYTARWREYVQMKDEYLNGKKTGKQVTTGMWEKMPWTMLGKCALARALRMGFPAKLSGIYTTEEMMQADSALLTGEIVDADPPAIAAPAGHVAPAQRPTAAPATSRTSVPSPVPAPVQWNPLGDTAFRKRCNALGYISISQVEELLAASGAVTDTDGVYHREKALAYVVHLEAKAAEAAQKARKAVRA